MTSRLTDSAQVPQAVVDGSNTSTVLGMAELSEQERRRKLSQAVAETHQETTTLEHCKRVNKRSKADE